MMEPRAKPPVLIAEMLFLTLSALAVLCFKMSDIAGTELLFTNAAAIPLIVIPKQTNVILLYRGINKVIMLLRQDNWGWALEEE
jgi:hypothetical protein